ncbi:D-hexose-6-phosphate mutarotase [Pseudocolwellia sp. HL-MZ19]|uniref:D-hexose-6-phosphate mutarotase n=1 Tax=unclassified Pseudocolwellia TaxID=2848178 RepID=UPI003CEE4A6D
MSSDSIEKPTQNISQSNEFGHVEQTTFSDKKALTTTDGLQIEHDLFTASISLYGGHVLSWQPKGQQPVFWMSNDSLFGNDKGIRGGIPICLPWFGGFEADLFQHNKNVDLTHVDKGLLANHGFARTSLWQVESIEITQDTVKVILAQAGENKTPAWDIAYQLKQEIVFGQSFSQKLLIENKSAKDVEYTGALHSYFAVGDPQKTHLNELSEVAYFDKLTGTFDNISHLENCKGAIDRVYQSNSVMNIVDNDWKRTLEVTSYDCHQWVLWNPGKATADSMDDIHSQGENEYVCLEAANTNPVKIPANSSVSLAQSIRIKEHG